MLMEEMGRAVQFHYGRKTPLTKLWHAVDCKMHSEFIDIIMWEKYVLESVKDDIQEVEPQSLAGRSDVKEQGKKRNQIVA